MRQIFFIEEGRVEWREVPSPHLTQPSDALVRPIAVATCDLDTALVAGSAPFPGPFPLGHEGVGEVIEVGSAVTTVTVGQRVIIPFQISCGSCARCQRGLTAHCEQVDAGAMYGLEPFGGSWGGFLGDAVRVPWADHMLIPLPDAVDPLAVASLSDNICDGWRTVVPFIDAPSDTSVLVVASPAPSIPFYTVSIATAIGVGRVDYLQFGSNDESQLEKARRAGATIVEGPDDVGSQTYTVTVCSASDPAALRLALRAVEPDGVCAVNTIFFDDPVAVPMFAMYTRGATLVTGRVNARAVMPKALELIASGALHPEEITDEIVDWDDAAEALMGPPRKLVIRR